MRKYILFLTVPLLVCSAVSSAMPKINGSVCRTNPSADWYHGSGVYELATESGGTFTKISVSQSSISTDYGAVTVGNVFYAFSANETPWFSNYIIEAFSMDTFDRIPMTTADIGKTSVASALVYDDSTGKTYGCFFKSSSGFQFGTIDLPELPDASYKPTVTPIADVEGRWSAMAMNGSGELFAVDATSGMLLRVDKTTGVVTGIGDTGLTTTLQSSAVIDKSTGKMYYSHTQAYNDVKLYEIDLSTGQASLVADWENNPQVTFMYIPVSSPDPEGVPQAPVNLKASFPEGALSGTITFDVPAQTALGEQGTGEVGWKLAVNDVSYAEGITSFGNSVSVPVNVEGRGLYSFSVCLTNGTGSSEEAVTTVFAGLGTPSAPGNPAAVLADGTVTVTWDAVTTTADGGYFDASQIRYNVWRIDGDNRICIGEWLNRTNATDRIGEPEDNISYVYAIEAFYRTDETVKSEPAMTNPIVIGFPEPPYVQEFNTSDAVSEFTILNSNGDPFTWKYFRGRMRMQVTGTTPYPMDDWLITPSFRLEKGKMYPVEVDLEGNIGYSEIAEIKAGRSATVEGMALTVMSPTVLTDHTETYTGYIIPQQTGAHCLGIHAMTGENCFYIFADNIRIGAGTSAAVPAAVSNLTVTPDYSGEPRCTLVFTLPAFTAEGNPLDRVKTVKILRDGTMISEAAPESSEVVFTDTDVAAGYHTYSVVATNDDGDGIATSARVFVGVGVPAIPAGASVKEIEEGVVSVTWNPVTTDQDGNTLNPALVTYKVYDFGTGELMADDVAGTSVTFAGAKPGEQVWGEYAVYAVTSAGQSITSGRTGMIPVGKPYAIPYSESFPDGRVSNLCGMFTADLGGRWEIMTDCDMTGLDASDHDNGYAAMVGNTVGSSAAIYSGKIDLRDAESPVLTFRAFDQYANGNFNDNTVEVQIDGGEGFKPVRTFTICDLDPASGGNHWAKAVMSLADFTGKIICYRLLVSENVYTYTMIDDIRVHERLAQDLDLRNIEAPGMVAQNEPFTISVDVENLGSEPADGWSVELYADGTPVDSRQGEMLAPDARCEVDFRLSHSPMHNERVEYSARIIYSSDGNLLNNESEIKAVSLRKNYLPAPTMPVYSRLGNDVSLSWEKPDLSRILPAGFRDTFEDYPGFLTDGIGDWTITDVDGGIIGSLGTGDIPGIPDNVGPAAFFTLDVSGGGEEGKLAAHSGVKYIASMFLKDKSQADDWLISPELCGAEQTITFFAKSYHATYCENIEVLVSETGTETGDFEKIAEFSKLSTAWTEFAVSLPSGSRYFAIRNVTAGGFMLMVDDISFIPAGEPEALEIVGYNVYLDGVKLNDVPVRDLHFSHSQESDVSQGYTITCVYDKGESGPSALAAQVGGISQGTLWSADVRAGKGEIIVSNPAGNNVEIISLAGIVIYNGTPGSDMRIPALPGIYIVKVAGVVAKLIVK